MTIELPDVGKLAWEGDRRSEFDLDDDTRRLLEGIVDYLDTIIPPEPEPDVQAAFDVLEDELEALGIETTAPIGPQIDELLQEAREEGVKDATIPSRASTAERKAMRLLLERRLEVTRVEVAGEHAGLVVAVCKGDSGSYQLGYDPHRKQWRCTCQELRGGCSHIRALKMITSPSPDA